MTVMQISVFLENKAGELNKITEILANNSVNLKAISVAETNDYGIIRLITDDVDKAKDLLINEGMVISVNPVQIVSVPNIVGGLNALLAKIAKAGININYMYSILGGNENEAQMIFKTDNPVALDSLFD